MTWDRLELKSARDLKLADDGAVRFAYWESRVGLVHHLDGVPDRQPQQSTGAGRRLRGGAYTAQSGIASANGISAVASSARANSNRLTSLAA
jgi:hypothetical protein